MSRRKQLSVVFDVANAQKQGVTGVRLALRPVRLCFKRERHLGRADMDAVTSVTHQFIKLIISRCSAVASRRKYPMVVFAVANAQKQEAMEARPALRPVRLCFKRERHLGRAERKALISQSHIFIDLIISRCSAVGSAPVSGTGGLEFESPHFDQKRTDSPCGCLFFFCLRVRFKSIRAHARRSAHAPSEDLKACFQGERREHLRPRRIPPHRTALVVVCSFFVGVGDENFTLRSRMEYCRSGFCFF